jgi:hypothetical protein
MADELKSLYGPVLSDLHARRAAAHAQLLEDQRQVRELDNLIAGIGRIVSPANSTVAPPLKKYADISVRWAILDLLSTARLPMTTAEIAAALTEAGVVTKATNFTNNISAVLSSTMKSGKQEVTQTSDGSWELTERGRNCIFHIREMPEFRRRCPWYSAPTALTAGALPKGGDAQ